MKLNLEGKPFVESLTFLVIFKETKIQANILQYLASAPDIERHLERKTEFAQLIINIYCHIFYGETLILVKAAKFEQETNKIT